MRFSVVAGSLLVLVSLAPAASAQRHAFTRVFPVDVGVRIDVDTSRGSIDVVGGPAGEVRLEGAATVRAGWGVPADADLIARRVASTPPITASTTRITLPPPARDVDRAVTLSYRLVVPRDAAVTLASHSGAIAVRDVTGALAVTTGSGALSLDAIGGAVVRSRSGAVRVDGASGAVRVETGSAGIDLASIAGDVWIRTRSGHVRAGLTGASGADIESGSSAIDVTGLAGATRVHTRSGEVRLQGRPSADWDIDTRSGRIGIRLADSASCDIDARSGSGDVEVEGVAVRDSRKGVMVGRVGAGGPRVHAATRSAAVEIEVGQ